MNPRQRRLYAALAVPISLATVAMLSAAPGATAAGPSTTPGTATFTNFEPAGLMSLGLNNGGGKVGTTCPGAKGCYNNAAEPAIRADGAGNFYASSENGLGAGTEAWKSTDGGRHYTTLRSPNQASAGDTTLGLSPAGGDTDLAVGDDLNPQGNYSVYVASLNLASIVVSSSTDGGNSFVPDPAASRVPIDDREWIAADDAHQGIGGVPVEGGEKVCVSYHDIASSDIHVDCSYDGGLAFTQTASAIDATHGFLIDNNMIGNMQIAQDTVEGDHTAGNHNIYQVFSGPADPAGATTACGVGSTCFNTVWLAYSTDGGVTFTDVPVYTNPKTSVTYGHQFVNVSVDRKGNVYVVYSDNHNMFYSYSHFSKASGFSFSRPVRINAAPANTAIEPWSVAGDYGKLDVVYYGTSATGNPEKLPKSAQWHVYFAQNLDVFGNPTGFTQVAASPVNHTGPVCEGGVGCTGNRDLFDDFGVAASPTTGRASIVYSDDQFRNGDANNPNNPSCSAGTTNSGSCDHTAFATQLTGGKIYGR